MLNAQHMTLLSIKRLGEGGTQALDVFILRETYRVVKGLRRKIFQLATRQIEQVR